MEYIIYLLIVLATVLQSATTKLFHRESSNPMVFNAVKAGVAFAVFALSAISGFTFHMPTMLFGMFYGISLSISMCAGYYALSLGPMSVTSMLASLSVLLPILWGIAVRKESFGGVQYTAIVFLILAMIMTNANKHQAKQTERIQHGQWLLFVGLTFVCNGICSILQTEHQKMFPGHYNQEFMFFAMLLCVLVFLGLNLKKMQCTAFQITKGIGYAVISGITNGAANFLTLMLAGYENASVLFPIVSAGTVLGSLFCGKILFKEKLKWNQYIALAAGIIAVVLLKI